MNCKELGYKIGDKFEVVTEGHTYYNKGDIVKLVKDDGTDCPQFKRDGDGSSYYCMLERLKSLEKTMDIKEAYKIMSQNCGIKVGDTVKVLRGFTTKEVPTELKWLDEKKRYIGKLGKVVKIDFEGDMRIQFNDDEWYYPHFVLEKIKDAEEFIKIGRYEVEFNKGSIKVGCQNIDYETIKKIYDRAKATL